MRYIAVTLPKRETRLTDILKTWQFTGWVELIHYLDEQERQRSERHQPHGEAVPRA